MTFSSKERRLVCLSIYLAGFSNNASEVVAGVAASTGGILPPPPPPPPHQKQSILSDRVSVAEESGVASFSVSSDLPAEKHDREEEEEAQKESTENIISDDTLKHIIPTAGSKITSDNTIEDSIWGKGGDDDSQNVREESQNIWEATTDASISAQKERYPQTNMWGNNEQSSQYQWQQQSPSWEQPTDESYQQQQYFQQQQQYQQQQPYQSQQYQYTSPPPQHQQSRQFRPAPSSHRRSAASGIFSLAVKKLQTGIDTVSESLESFDANKVASGVSGLTSKISSIAGSSGGPPGRNDMSGQRRPMMGNTGRGPGVGRPPQPQRQNQYPQRIPPESRQQHPTKKEETYAPPISELYSFEQQPGMNGGSIDKEDDTDEHTDGEDELNPDPMMQHEQAMPTEQPGASTTEPDQWPPSPDKQIQQPFRTVEKPRSIPPHPVRRDMQSSALPRPRNGGRPTPSATASRRVYEGRYDDDDDDSSIGHKIKATLGAFVPRVPRLFKRSDDAMFDDGGAWSDDEESSGTSRGFFSGRSKSKDVSYQSSIRSQSSGKSGIIPRPVQSLLEKRETLLSNTSSKKCASIGRSQAVLDVGQVALLVVVLREVSPLFFDALTSVSNEGGIRQAIISTIVSSIDGWAPFALAAVFLLSASNNVWIQPALKSVYEEAAAENSSDAAYTQLYLRLISSLPIQKSFSSDVMKRTAKAQALQLAAMARLRFFVTLAVLYVLLSTVAVLQPAGSAVMSAVVDVVRLDAWRESPINWKNVLEGAKSVGLSLAKILRTLFGSEWDVIRQQPLRVAVVLSLLVALLSVSYLPSFEKRRKSGVQPPGNDEEDEEDDVTSLWSNIGASSATRLGLLSSPRGVEGALDQFAKLRPDRAAQAGIGGQRKIKKKRGPRGLESSDLRLSAQSLLRTVLYSTSSFVLLSIPLAIYFYLFARTEAGGENVFSVKSVSDSGWVSLLEMATLLGYTHLQVGSAVNSAIDANKVRLAQSVSTFFHKLANTVKEMQNLAAESSSGADFQAMLTASPTKGIVVSDLWAAHSFRRSWAVKGANIQCQNGEVVLIIGADGSGKTRLLTAIAEHIFAPPKSARTTTFVRGLVNVGGVELPKWDRVQLQKRVGVFLNDVNTVSDYASLMAGCTLDEILEPVPPEGGRIGPKERNSMSVAMKITGLEKDLLSRLPSKLATVVNSEEDKLKPSSLRAPSYPLSPSDWTRVVLTKILACAIAGNENQLSAPDTVRKCMIGSVLLLDDATSQMSETNEAKLVLGLRSSGAAVLLTSNRWASGRFADRIVVIQDGSVVESGTHNDLMNLGPERSVYAKNWSDL